MTLETLRERLWRMLGVDVEPGTEALFPAFWTAAQANRALNDAYQEICRTTGALEMRQVIEIVAGTADYTLDEATGPVLRVAHDDYPLESFDPTEFDRTDDYWRTATGQISMYHLSRLNPQRIRTYKVPDTSGTAFTFEDGLGGAGQVGVLIDTSATDTFDAELGVTIDLDMDGVEAVFSSELGIIIDIESSAMNLEVWSKRVPPALALDEDEPELPAWSHLTIAYAAAVRLLSVRGEGAQPAKAAAYQALAGEGVSFLATIVRERTREKGYILGTPAKGRFTGERTPWTGAAADLYPIPHD